MRQGSLCTLFWPSFVVMAFGLALNYAVNEWCVPKDENGYFLQPLDIVWTILIMGISGGIGAGWPIGYYLTSKWR